MQLCKSNERITIAGVDAIRILQELELILISLRTIGTTLGTSEGSAYERETTRFIDEWSVTDRLAVARELLTERFDRSLGDDHMDDLERAMESLQYWENAKTTSQ